MDGLIDPPSSITRFDIAAARHHATKGELIVIGTLPVAAMVMQEMQNTLYLGKIAVAEEARGRGYAKQLITYAAEHARALGLPNLTLQSRIELRANHAAFAAMGFVESGRTAHAGFDKPTSITFTRTL